MCGRHRLEPTLKDIRGFNLPVGAGTCHLSTSRKAGVSEVLNTHFTHLFSFQVYYFCVLCNKILSNSMSQRIYVIFIKTR